MKNKFIKKFTIAIFIEFFALTTMAQINGGLPPINNQNKNNISTKIDLPNNKKEALKNKLDDIIKNQGFDYIINSAPIVSKLISEKENIEYSSILLYERRNKEAEKILIDFASKGNLNAISDLATYYGTGEFGFSKNRFDSMKWINELEKISRNNDKQKSKQAYRSLCSIHHDIKSINYNRLKALEYCNFYYNELNGSSAGYADKLIDSSSPLYDPEKGVELYRKCISEGNNYCKMNFAFAGKSNLHISKNSSKTELFNFAISALDQKSSVGINNLATFYLHGFGTEKNPSKAIELLKSSARSRVVYSYYNFLNIAFFKYYDISDIIKNKDDALNVLSYYEYLSAANDRDDSSTFKEWLNTKNRLPNDKYEFITYLEEKSRTGDAASACLLADHYVHNGELNNAEKYSKIGMNTSNLNIKLWCEKVGRSVEVERTIRF